MGVTIMQSITSLLPKLSADFPNIRFITSDDFHWSPKDQTVYFNPKSGEVAQLFHELSHAILEHNDYSRDINLLKMERDAWEHARKLADNYAIDVDEDVIQDHLDTYRAWLHDRSTCPDCTATGLQTDEKTYHCIACGTDWRVNEAKTCQLRRYKTKTPA